MSNKICVTKDCGNQYYSISSKFCVKCGEKAVIIKKFTNKTCKNSLCIDKDKLRKCSTEFFCGECGFDLFVL
jgi:hypothetical protein